MPAYDISRTWTDPIALSPGDAVQNRGLNRILMSREEPPSDTDALSLAPAQPWIVRAPMTVRFATAGRTASRLVIARGLSLKA